MVLQSLTLFKQFEQLRFLLDYETVISVITLRQRASRVHEFLLANAQAISQLGSSEKQQFSSLLGTEKTNLEDLREIVEAGLIAAASTNKENPEFQSKKEILFSPQGEIVRCFTHLEEIAKKLDEGSWSCCKKRISCAIL
jgi:hypothetical protein